MLKILVLIQIKLHLLRLYYKRVIFLKAKKFLFLHYLLMGLKIQGILQQKNCLQILIEYMLKKVMKQQFLQLYHFHLVPLHLDLRLLEILYRQKYLKYVNHLRELLFKCLTRRKALLITPLSGDNDLINALVKSGGVAHH